MRPRLRELAGDAIALERGYLRGPGAGEDRARIGHLVDGHRALAGDLDETRATGADEVGLPALADAPELRVREQYEAHTEVVQPADVGGRVEGVLVEERVLGDVELPVPAARER